MPFKERALACFPGTSEAPPLIVPLTEPMISPPLFISIGRNSEGPEKFITVPKILFWLRKIRQIKSIYHDDYNNNDNTNKNNNIFHCVDISNYLCINKSLTFSENWHISIIQICLYYIDNKGSLIKWAKACKVKVVLRISVGDSTAIGCVSTPQRRLHFTSAFNWEACKWHGTF